MTMRPSKKSRAGVLLALAVLFSASLLGNSDTSISVLNEGGASDSLPRTPMEVLPYGTHATSDVEPLVGTGILNPAELEHQGYAVSPNTTVRTDLDPNIYYDLPLDSAHNWTASTADVSVCDLKKMYAVNGTFQTGTSGTNYAPEGDVTYHPVSWDALSNSTNAAQNQTASYDSSGTQFVTVENWGVKIGLSGVKYTHYAGTRVLWFQDIVNHPYSDQFIVSFSYLYARGPLFRTLSRGNCSISLFLDGEVMWNQSLPSLDTRGTWYSTGSISINASGVGSTFRLMIGLVIDEDMALNANEVYDGVSPNGMLNTVYITAYLDNVVMLGQTAPSFDHVDMKLTAGGETSSVSGTDGNGQASVVFDPRWTTDPLRMTISSNDTVSYTYRVRMFAHYYVNSTWTTAITNQGVSYIADTHSVNMSFFFYVGSVGSYEDFSIIIRHPQDWSNVTVLDPLQYDATGACFMTSGEVIIPGTAIVLFGWWEVHLQSPNYAESIAAQKYDAYLSEWAAAPQYRSGNITRAQIVIGSDGQHPDVVTGLEVTWRLPSGATWALQSLSGPGALLNSSQLTLGGTNTTAGLWAIDIFWMNGTEIALGRSTFEVIHRTTLTPLNYDITTTVNSTVTNFVVFRDIDNGEYLMAESASIVTSFGGLPVVFVPNLVRNWWEGDFNVSLINYGVTQVSVNAVLEYYDPSSCTFTIAIPYPTTLEFALASGEWITAHIGETILMPFSYSMWNGTGVSTLDFDLVYQGPTGGLTSDITEEAPTGNYTLSLVASASGVYEVTLQGSKAGYEAASDSLLLSVTSYAADLTLPNGSAELINFGDDYSLFIRYTNGSGFGIEGASVNITCSPSANISVGAVADLGDGYYSVLLNPHDALTFTVTIDVTFPDYQRQLSTFILDVADISTILQYEVSSHTVAIDRNATVTLFFTDEDSNPVVGATIAILDPPAGLYFATPIELGNGYYEIAVVPSQVGLYTVTFGASTSTHRLSIVSLQLSIVQVPTVASAIASGVIEFGSGYVLLLQYNRTDDHTLVTGATVNASSASPGLSWLCVEVAQGYELHFMTNSSGSWYIDIVASKENHGSRLVTFILTVTAIETRISVSTPVNSLHVNRENQLSISFLMLNETGVDQASIEFARDMVEWFTFEPLGNGLYAIALMPTSMGTFTTMIRLEKVGFQTQSYEFVYSIYPIPVRILTNDTVWPQGDILFLKLTLVESDTNQTVSNATVWYQLVSGDTPLTSGYMDYVGNGKYTTHVNLAWVDSRDLSVSFVVSKANYETEGRIEWQVIAEPNITIIMISNFLTFGVPPIAVVAVAAVFRQVRITRRNRREAERAENALIRGRFRDVHNIIGVLALHKVSGLPVYSRSLKPGLDEGIVSAFISAIATFRSEFQMDENRWAFTVLPISDIIRAVATKSLIFALVTVEPPSKEQEDKLLSAAKEAAQMFDELYEAAPDQFAGLSTAEAFDDIVERHLDGALLEKYILNPEKPLAESMALIKEAIGEPQPVTGFALDGLARLLASLGKEDLVSYRLVWDALSGGFFVRVSTPRDMEQESGNLDWKPDESP